MRRWTSALAIAALIVLSSKGGNVNVRAQEEAAEQVIIGVVHASGLLVPFGRFAGSLWTNTWPEPKRGARIPGSTAVIPAPWLGLEGDARLPQTWSLFRQPQRGMRMVKRTIHAEALRVHETHCEQGIGLSTDFVDPTVEDRPHTSPKSKAGIAVWRDGAPVERIDAVHPSSPEGVTVTAFATPIFNRLEQKAYPSESRQQSEWHVPRGVRARERIRWLKISRYVDRQSRVTTYLLHAEKVYTHLGYKGYKSVSGGQLWIQRIDAALHLRDANVELTDEDRKGLTLRDPLGVIVTEGRRFWISQRNTWEYEEYEIVEVSPEGLQRVLTVSAGGC